MRSIDPVLKGMIGAGGFIFVAAAIVSALFSDLEPSSELLRAIAGIGASFFLAYVIEATWLVKQMPSEKADETFLGILMGFAVCGLTGVIFALMLSENSSTDSFGRSEDVLFWWSIISLGGLGMLVSIQPGLVHIERQDSKGKSESPDETG